LTLIASNMLRPYVRWRSETTHQQRVSRSGQQSLNVLLASGVNVHRLHSCWRRTFCAHAVIQLMWY